MLSIARFALVVGAAVGALAVPTTNLPSVASQEGRIIPGKWIVSLKPGLAKREIDDHLGWVDVMHKRSLSRRDSVGVERTFSIGKFQAYVGELDDDIVAEIGAKAEVRNTIMITITNCASFPGRNVS